MTSAIMPAVQWLSTIQRKNKMKYAAETGVYSLKKCLWEDLFFSKDNSPAIPYKEEYFRKFFDVLDDILLSAAPVRRIVGFHVHFPKADKHLLDYGHWEILLILMLFSLIGARIKDEKIRKMMQDKCFFCDGKIRFDWHTLHDFYNDKIANFTLDDFLKLPDDELSELEKILRVVAESAWEYTNCIDLSNDAKCCQVIETLLKKAYFMVVAAPDDESSLQTAASMYGAFVQLLDTKIETLDAEWKIFEGDENECFAN